MCFRSKMIRRIPKVTLLYLEPRGMRDNLSNSSNLFCRENNNNNNNFSGSKRNLELKKYFQAEGWVKSFHVIFKAFLFLSSFPFPSEITPRLFGVFCLFV